MKTTLCTLYNSLYLDKGLVLYDSLCKVAADFVLYVLCMDDKCFDVINELNQPNHIPIRLSDFERGDDALLEAKKNRSVGEYCWTCSSSLIRYVLKQYNEDICTYIDADMYFYNDPQILVDEMLKEGKSALVVPHRFNDNKRGLASKVGIYCVEFNTFRNNEDGLEALEYWRSRCLECCSNLNDGIHWGDQKYLEELVEKFDYIHVCENEGAGVASWNIENLSMSNNSDKIVFNKNHVPFQIVFYHYAAIRYFSRNVVSINIQCGNTKLDYSFISSLYTPYLRRIKAKQEYLFNKYKLCNIQEPNGRSVKYKRILYGSRLYKMLSRSKLCANFHFPYIIILY